MFTPELSVYSGMPAATTASAAAVTPAGSASEIAIPDELDAMAASISWDCASASLLEPKYTTSQPIAFAASRTATSTTDQNTPESPWVITW